MPPRPFHAFLLSNFRMVRVRCSAGSTVPLFFHRRLHSRIPSTVSQKPTSRFLLCSSKSSKSAWFRPRPPVVPLRTVHDIARTDDGMDPAQRFTAMKLKLEEEGIKVASFNPGQYSRSICPKCGGGTTKETSLSLFAREDGELVMWSCFRAKCGWKGNMTASGVGKSYHVTSNQTSKAYRVISEEDLQLEPLCEELITYFSVRMISAETLRRNYVMQRNYNEQVVIAFTYRRHGLLVSCKYRGVNKKFWQEKDTERIFYGVDDIKQAGDIIIDTKFQFLWNCKTYLEKASRIILATDGDLPGQALAEELARRLGKERCSCI